MADDAKLVDGFYRDIPISISSGSIAGGRKKSIKQFPNKDTQNVEDMGLKPRQYTLEIVINDKANQDYFAYRDRLLAALESSEPAPLIHPYYGRIEDVVAVTYNFSERISEFGYATIIVNFEVDTNTGIPQQSLNVSSQLEVKNEAVVSAVNNDIASRFKVTNSFAGNFSAAVDKVNEIIDSINDSTSFLGETADTINVFNSELGDLSANVNSLVTAPISLADSITGIFSTVNGLYASTEATFQAFRGFFDFGDSDTPIKQTTSGLIERNQNNDVLNGAVKAQALGYSYVSAAAITYTTTREIDSATQLLEDQYKIVLNSNTSQEVKDSVTELRLIALESLKQSRVIASQIITVNTLPTTARVLAFTYYGNDNLGDNIVNLNGINDVSFVDGDVEILTA